MTAPPLTVIRVSSLANYPDCPRRAASSLFWHDITAAGYTLGRTMRGIGAAIGTAVHKSAEVSLRTKAAAGVLPPLDVATDAAFETLGRELVGPTPILWDQTSPNPRTAEHQVLAMARMYHRTVAPTIEPIVTEERLEAEVEPGLVLSGQPDTVAREPHAVRDLKTGVRAPGSFAPQLGGYSLLARSHKLTIDTASIDFLRRVTIKKPQPEPVSKTVTVAQAETAASNILRHIAGDIATFRNGDRERRLMPGDSWAFLANPASMLCSPKYCRAFGTDFCREGDPTKATKEGAE